MNFDSFYNRGQTRRVFKFGKYVIKFPVFKVFSWEALIYSWQCCSDEFSVYSKVKCFILNFLYGFWCNLHEYNAYKQLSDTVYADRFAKVYYCCPLGLFLIQERVIRKRSFKLKALIRYKHIYTDIQNNTEGIDWTLDFNYFNFGFRGRKLVCIDFT